MIKKNEEKRVDDEYWEKLALGVIDMPGWTK
jgi:hypothetical protein